MAIRADDTNEGTRSGRRPMRRMLAPNHRPALIATKPIVPLSSSIGARRRHLTRLFDGLLALSRYRRAASVATRKPSVRRRVNAFAHARALITDACEIAGMPSLVEDARNELGEAGVIRAIRRQDNGPIFDWLIDALSYQGVSNAVAYSYIQTHGNATHASIRSSLDAPVCDKLRSWWHFEDCSFRKLAFTCSQPHLVHRCPLPRLPLRNGSLNRTAFGLSLFFRDICRGNFVRWLDERLAAADRPRSRRRGKLLAESIVGPLRQVHGISDKALNMSISMLLLGGDPARERWIRAGGSMIAVDTLIHAWMSRTGTLRRLKCEHPYGPRCYARDGCADIIRRVAQTVDASRFNPEFPRIFPRFVQVAIWKFCAQSGYARCNGLTVPDGSKCRDSRCELYVRCDRIVQPRREPASR